MQAGLGPLAFVNVHGTQLRSPLTKSVSKEAECHVVLHLLWRLQQEGGGDAAARAPEATVLCAYRDQVHCMRDVLHDSGVGATMTMVDALQGRRPNSW